MCWTVVVIVFTSAGGTTTTDVVSAIVVSVVVFSSAPLQEINKRLMPAQANMLLNLNLFIGFSLIMKNVGRKAFLLVVGEDGC